MKAKVSALMDGELAPREAAGCIGALGSEHDAIEAWRVYHLISDAMRNNHGLSHDFCARVASDIEAEPTVLAPSAARGSRTKTLAWSAAASAAAIAWVAWLGLAPQREASPGLSSIAPVAQGPAKELARPASAVASVPLPDATDDYLLAHQGYSPRSSLQGVAPYVRSVSERRPAGATR
jgi:sigma-E factor negative regulatory protein RseA